MYGVRGPKSSKLGRGPTRHQYAPHLGAACSRRALFTDRCDELGILVGRNYPVQKRIDNGPQRDSSTSK